MTPGRPAGVTALAVFFGAGAVIAATSCVSLLYPGGVLEPMWRLNPRARDAFSGIGAWSNVLLAAVALACAAAAAGLWRGRRWGHRLAVLLIGVNLAGDIVNVALGVDRRAAVGVPIAAAILAYLLHRRARAFFAAASPAVGD
jgi:Predicted membrane protein (DUF2127)